MKQSHLPSYQSRLPAPSPNPASTVTADSDLRASLHKNIGQLAYAGRAGQIGQPADEPAFERVDTSDDEREGRQ